MELRHPIEFEFDLALPAAEAVAFVRDAAASLARADFLEDLVVEEAGEGVGEGVGEGAGAGAGGRGSVGGARVEAALPVNAALFGQQRLRFRSRVVPEPDGARLVGLELPDERPGWAQVSGRAEVAPLPSGSRVAYRFDVAIHLDLPEAERWGGRALARMIEFTARTVLERVTARFPDAVQAAAREAEAAYA